MVTYSTGRGLSLQDITEALRKERKTDSILKIVKDMQDKLETQNKLLVNIAVTVSKLYQAGELNKDTFNKLDEFLRDYYEQPYSN